jgi:hypothetical protein
LYFSKVMADSSDEERFSKKSENFIDSGDVLPPS